MSTGPTVSFELFPTTSEAADAALWRTVDRLAPLDPAFISVTYGAGGSTRERTGRILKQLVARGDVRPTGHLTCVGATKAETEALVREWHAAGITRIVALRGDPPADAAGFVAHPDGYQGSADLVAGLKAIADFDVSVGAYPEPHPDARGGDTDIDYLKRKFDAGADRAITQYFFDAEVFLRFRDRAAAAGIDKPIVPGILPVTNFAKVVSFSKRCGASVPRWLADMFDGLDDDPETRMMVAATVASELCAGLQEEGVDTFHFYTLNRAELSFAICRRLGIRPDIQEAA